MLSCLKKRLRGGMIKGLKKREFNVVDYVLLYNFRLRFFVGKFFFKWEGFYIVEEVYCSGVIKINNTEGNFQIVVNGQRIKYYI